MLDLTTELSYTFSRSGGKGGQHANKVETKVALRFDIPHSQLLNERQKSVIQERLDTYISQEGVLQLMCDETRSQLRNKEIVTQRFFHLLKTALTPRKKRKRTWVPRSAKEKRLKYKKMRSEKKKNRRVDGW